MITFYIAFAASAVGMVFALFLTLKIIRQDNGNETIQFIGKAIEEGAMAFLSREYRLLSIFVVAMFIVLAALIDYDVLNRIETHDDRSIPSTAIAYLLRFYIIAKAGPVFLSYVAYLIPIFAILWGVIFLNEKILINYIIAIIFIFLGIFIGEKGSNENKNLQ